MTAPDVVPPADLTEPSVRCTREPWCVKEAGHRGYCRRTPLDVALDEKGRPLRGATGNGRPSGGGGAAGRGGQPPTPDRPSSRAPARRKRSRSPWEVGWAAVYGSMGRVLESVAPEPPDGPGPAPGRVMQFQAADAGVRIHRLLQKVGPYKSLSAMTGGSQVSDDLMKVLGPPLLTVAMAMSEQARLLLYPFLGSMLQDAAVTIAVAEKEQADALESVSEHSERVDALMGELAEILFAPRPKPPQEEEPRGEPPAGGGAATPFPFVSPQPFTPPGQAGTFVQ